MRNRLRAFWLGWKKGAEAFSRFMNGLLLAVFYFTVLLPYGLAVRFFPGAAGDFRRGSRRSGWGDLPGRGLTRKDFSSQY